MKYSEHLFGTFSKLHVTSYVFLGYRGWGCTDDKKAISSTELLLGTLLLTLSNLFFIPAIVVALRRKFFTEALLYASTMFFSTVIHLHLIITFSFVHALFIYRITHNSVLHVSSFIMPVTKRVTHSA